MSTKGLSHPQLHDDEDNVVAAVTDFLQRRWQTLAIVALIVVTAVIASGLVLRSRKNAESEAHALWFRAQEDVVYGDFAAAEEAAGVLLDRYAGTPSGKKAILIKADALAGQGKFAEAQAIYEEAVKRLGGDALLRTSARRGLAVALENQGNAAGASAIYEDLSNTAEPSGGRVFDLRAAARCQRVLGSTERAVALLQRLIDTYGKDDDRVARDQVHLAKVAVAEWGYVPK